MKPLSGLRVLEFTQALSGPFCGMLMADMGADIVKFERPSTGGDSSRYNAPGVNGVSVLFPSRNRGKKSVLMDLSNPRQKEIFLSMVNDADVVLENFKPGTMEKYGCGYDVLKNINPGIILTSISGFGQTGPLKKRAAYDVLIQAEAGIISVSGTKDGIMAGVGYSITDVLAGMNACIGTLMALYGRAQTGMGRHVDISMLDSSIATMEALYGSYFMTGDIPGTIGIGHPLAAPFEPFPTKDGEQIMICVNTDEQWERLCEALGHPELRDDERFSSSFLRKKNETVLEEILPPITTSFNSEDLCAVLERADMIFGHVNNIKEAVESEQFAARQMECHIKMHGTDTVISALASAVKMSDMEHQVDYEAYPLGYHTIEEFSKYADPKLVHEIYDSTLAECAEIAARRKAKAGII